MHSTQFHKLIKTLLTDKWHQHQLEGTSDLDVTAVGTVHYIKGTYTGRDGEPCAFYVTMDEDGKLAGGHGVADSLQVKV